MHFRDLYRAIFEQSGDQLLLMERGPDGVPVILEANPAALTAHGYSREEVVGQPLSLLDPYSSIDAFAEIGRSTLEGTIRTLEVRHRRKDGSLFDLEVRVGVVEFGGRRLIASIERDIGERKRAQAALEHSHALMSYVISHARSAIAVHDRDLRYIYVSERYLREYNVSERDIIGRHHYEVFPDLPQKWRDAHQRALHGEASCAEEDPFITADGTVEWTRWECRPWYESDGSIGGIIVYTEVITERKRAEEERQALQAQLQQAMKMEAVGRLAGGVAHDFNNLLTGIMGNIELALLDLAPSNPLTPTLREVRRAAESAAELTRQLLSFSRKQVIEPRVFDLNDLVLTLQPMLARLIGEDVALGLALDGHATPVRVDASQFEQVLVNLAVNARDAMPDGGCLTIETGMADLGGEDCATHPLVTPGRYARLSVTDTGHGMDETVRSRLFEPFFTTKPMGRGTGLGLATIFGAVKQAGGTIEVESEPGRGSRFTLYLPLADEAEICPAQSPDLDELPRGSETVLVVEDEPAVRDLAAKVLCRLGYSVVSAPDGTQALAAAGRHAEKLDLLVTDVVLPGMNGRQLAERLCERRPDVKVLFASGYTANVIAHYGVLDPGVNFLAKPYTPKALARKVRDVLDGKRQPDRHAEQG